MNSFKNSMLCDVTYDDVRKAMNNEPFTMDLTDRQEIKLVIQAVNQGIDSHLEACYVPDRGDSYGDGKREYVKSLACKVSVESMPVLLRRLSEIGDDAAISLVDSILTVLGFDDYGKLTQS